MALIYSLQAMYLWVILGVSLGLALANELSFSHWSRDRPLLPFAKLDTYETDAGASNIGLTARYSTARLPVQELNALISFYWATGGPDWNISTGWLTGDPCQPPVWYGLRCGFIGNISFVDIINLPRNNLYGNDLNSLSSLSNLRSSIYILFLT